jgi:hypothetical protein
MSPSASPRAGREGRRKADALNIIRYRKKSKSLENPLGFYERLLLCRLMVTGSSARCRYFIDPRNRLIYENLAWLQIQEYMPNTENLIRYLGECGVLNRAGGEMYVRDVFRGIPLGYRGAPNG